MIACVVEQGIKRLLLFLQPFIVNLFRLINSLYCHQVCVFLQNASKTRLFDLQVTRPLAFVT